MLEEELPAEARLCEVVDEFSQLGSRGPNGGWRVVGRGLQ